MIKVQKISPARLKNGINFLFDLKYGGLDGGITGLTKIAYDVFIFSTSENNLNLNNLKRERRSILMK